MVTFIAISASEIRMLVTIDTMCLLLFGSVGFWILVSMCKRGSYTMLPRLASKSWVQSIL